MAEHSVQIEWQLGAQEDFTAQRYSRRHTLRFDGGVQLVASSSPSVVPLPWSDASGVDPEELFVAALASCHMLWFLSLAAAQGHTVQHYEDDAIGHLARNAEGRMAMTLVTLRPRVRFTGDHAPDDAALRALHHHAHEACFIASSVKTELRCEPRIAGP